MRHAGDLLSRLSCAQELSRLDRLICTRKVTLFFKLVISFYQASSKNLQVLRSMGVSIWGKTKAV